MTRIPPALKAEIEGNAVEIRELVASRPTIEESLRDDAPLAPLLRDWGKLIAASIFGAGDENGMNMRALAWIEFLGGFE